MIGGGGAGSVRTGRVGLVMYMSALTLDANCVCLINDHWVSLWKLVRATE